VVIEMLLTEPFAPLITQLTGTAAFLPAADLAVGDEELVLTMDLPGLTSEDLSIELQENVLTVRGERKRLPAPEGASYLQAERPVGVFERQIQVPEGVDPDAITAGMERGVLSLRIPKPQRMKPKVIPIGAESEQRRLETAAA
jgi:HSP20 family protein